MSNQIYKEWEKIYVNQLDSIFDRIRDNEDLDSQQRLYITIEVFTRAIELAKRFDGEETFKNLSHVATNNIIIEDTNPEDIETLTKMARTTIQFLSTEEKIKLYSEANDLEKTILRTIDPLIFDSIEKKE